MILKGPDGVAGTTDDGAYPFTQRFTAFDPTSPTGVSNFGAGLEPTANNVLSGTVTIPQVYGGVTKRFGDTAFDRRVTAGSVLSALISSSNANVAAGAQTVCDVFDHTAYQLQARPVVSAGSDSIVLEYGHPAAYPSTSSALDAANCADADAVWSADPTSAVLTGSLTSDGFREGIDRVRLRWTGPVTPNVTSTVRVPVRVIAKSAFGGVTLVNRAVKSADGNISRDQDFGVWTLVNLGLVKAAVPQGAGTGNRYSAGETIPFTLTPTVGQPRSNVAPQNTIAGITVKDVLPATQPRLVVSPDTATVPPGVHQVEFCQLCDGSDWSVTPPSPAYGVRWSFDPVLPGTALPTLEFSALSEVETPTNTTYINSATISADPAADAPPATAVAPVVIDAPASVLATKTANTAVIGLNGTISHQLTVRNNTTTALNHFDVIDVLPYAADGRLPASAYSGGYAAVGVLGLPAGLVTYVTSAPPSALDAADGSRDGYADPLNPGDAGYTAPRSGVWSCTLAQVGTAGCPSAGQVTALRFAADAPDLLGSDVTFTWAVTLRTTGNSRGDIYTDRFVGRVDRSQLSLPIISPDASTKVVAPAVSIEETGCALASCDPNSDVGWSDLTLVPDGGVAAVRIRVTNTGDEAGDATVSDLIPAGLTLVPGSIVVTQGSVAGPTPAWSVGRLAVGAQAVLTFRVKPTDDLPPTTTSSFVTIVDGLGQSAANTDTTVIRAVRPALTAAPSVTTISDRNADGFADPGDTVALAIDVHNTGPVEFDRVVVAGSALDNASCPAGVLPIGASTGCTAVHTVTQADIAARSVSTSVTATGSPANGDPVTSDPVLLTQAIEVRTAAIELQISAASTASHSAGETIVFQFEISNAGNVPISNATLGDPRVTGTGVLSPIDCPPGAGSLSPGAHVVCTANYRVTQSDIDTGAVGISATASADDPGGVTVTSQLATLSVPVAVSAARSRAAALPFTGASVLGAVTIGLLLLSAGVTIVGARRRKRIH